MKKIVLICFVLICALTAFATNDQKIYSVDCDVYKNIQTLSIASGKGLPFSSGPWSGAELKLMLERIERNSLSAAFKTLYDKVEAELNPEKDLEFEDSSFDFGLDINLQAYLHNSDKVSKEEDWFHGFSSRDPFLEFRAETWAAKNFYGYFEFTVGDCLIDALYTPAFVHNLTVATGNSAVGISPVSSLDWTMPYKAIASAGGERWSFVAGRDKLSWGAGETGNLMLSDSFPTHTFAKFSTFSRVFKYSLLESVYPYYESTGSLDPIYQLSEEMNGSKVLILHRVEASMLKNKLNFALTEACMFRTVKGEGFSVAMINPFGFMHNEYVSNNGNSLLGFEADYSPIAGVNVYGQFVIDDFSVVKSDDGMVPTATGLLFGAKAAFQVGPGVLTGSAEFAKTDPYLYLRGDYRTADDGKTDSNHYGYGYDVYYRHFGNSAINRDNMFITYKYGNDVIIGDVKANYELSKFGKASLEYFFMAHGVTDITSPWGTDDSFKTNNLKTPTTVDFFSGKTGEIRFENIVSLSGEYYTPVKGLTANFIADYCIFKNHENVKDNNFTDLQITLGATYSL